MKTEAGMCGAHCPGSAGLWVRGCWAFSLVMMVVLGPGSAVGQTEGFEEEDAALLWESGSCEEVAELYLKEYPKGSDAAEARACLAEPRAAEIVLPDGLTLADWALMAEDRLKAGDHARLLEEAGAHLREYGPVESVEAVRKQAVSGLIAEVRVMVREDARGALDRIALIESAAGERPELLLLKAHAHGQLGDHAAEEAAYLQWLRSVPQTHPERRDVLSALARVRVAREKAKRFSKLLGRPFSHEWKEDSAGWTDLHYAALLDLPEAVTALVEVGMDVDTRLKDGHTPFGDDLKRTLAALGHGEFEDRTVHGETPLMIAAVGNARDAAAELIAQGADVSAREDNGGTALHYAARNNSLDVAKLLIERGADVSAKEDDDWTALHVTAWDNSLDVAKLLIERGADVSAKEDDDWTALHVTAWDNSLDVAKLLIERGADVSAETNNEWTPLHIAARDNSLDVAKLLIERGADVSAEDSGGETPLDKATERNHGEMQALLRRHGGQRKAERRMPGHKFRDCPECPELVVVPSGSFDMGSPESEEGRYDEEGPVHRVTFARPFAVGVYEVTFGEWDACVSGRGCGGHRPDDEGWGRGKRPAINVSWDDAKAYVRWLSRKTGEEYRLLSEAEWEYVARAGTTTRYWWGNRIGRNRANCDGCGSRWDYEQTAPVGSFSANPFGLHDVHGNVREWVEDCWNESYHGAPSDGSAWESGECRKRVLRGGSWNYEPRNLRSANRNWLTSGNRYYIDGFRVARTLTP